MTLWNDDVFSERRKAQGVADDFLNTGWGFADLKSGGGKGGSLMAFLETGFIVKELGAGDHSVLLAVARSYLEHVQKGMSLLCSILLHFRDDKTGKMFFAMKNAVGAGPFKSMLDIKGCADDKTLEKDYHKVPAVHKRIWHLHMWLGSWTWSEQRREYHQGKRAARDFDLGVAPDEHAVLIDMLRRDAAWLEQHRLMDYSLLVAVREGRRVERERSSEFAGRLGGEDVLVSVSIIDFLQTWGMGKRVARGIKVLECDKATIPPSPYARRFCKRIQQRFRADASLAATETELCDGVVYDV